LRVLRFSADKNFAGDMQNFLGSFSQLHEPLLISGPEVREPPWFLAPRYPGVIELAAREVLGSEALEYWRELAVMIAAAASEGRGD
jgi:hypothetical protein